MKKLSPVTFCYITVYVEQYTLQTSTLSRLGLCQYIIQIIQHFSCSALLEQGCEIVPEIFYRFDTDTFFRGVWIADCRTA